MFKMANMLIKTYSGKAAKEHAIYVKAAEKQMYEDLYKTEREEYYLIARDIFNSLSKQGKITKQELREIRAIIEECLGNYVKEYRGWKFDNEFHRIYTYMKSYHLDKSNWNQILSYLERVHQRSLLH